MACELNILVLLISGLGNFEQKRTVNPPTLSTLIGSGVSERYADLVLILNRQEYFKETKWNKGLADMYILRNVMVPTGMINLKFDKRIGTFGS